MSSRLGLSLLLLIAGTACFFADAPDSLAPSPTPARAGEPIVPPNGLPPAPQIEPPDQRRLQFDERAEQLDPTEVIRAALSRRINVDLSGTSLHDLVAELQKLLQVAVRVDRANFEEEGISDDMPISLTATGITVRSALHRILGPLKLAYTIHDETLVIITAEAARNTRTTLFYDVSDLVTIVDPVADKPVPRFNFVVELIQSNTGGEPDGEWEMNGGHGTILPMRIVEKWMLLIRQTQEGHEQITDFLNELRSQAKK